MSTEARNTELEAVTLKNGRPATQGTCLTCGTKLFRIGASR
ncbi:MAG: DUF5679 domain-containing protein [Dehalococcoidia bacterium]